MRTLSFCVLAAVLIASLPGPTSAQDAEATQRRVEASLWLPARLRPVPYLEAIMVPLPLLIEERGFDLTIPPFHEYGRWRLTTPIKVEVLGVVLETSGAIHALLLDNFAFPEEEKGRIQASPLLRSFGVL